jgi:flavin-dependent dehydrogenase
MPGFAGDRWRARQRCAAPVLCDEIPATFQWLLDSGVRFMGPMPEPPHRQPRMHNVLPNSRAFIYHLERRARRAGVDIRCGQRVTRLLQSGGRVTGVEAEAGGRPGHLEVLASRAVVLAAGDFTSSPELKAASWAASRRR